MAYVTELVTRIGFLSSDSVSVAFDSIFSINDEFRSLRYLERAMLSVLIINSK